MYIVIELQKNDTQTLSSFTWSYADEQQAWGKYYQILSVAATSNVPIHSAVLLSERGRHMADSSFTHTE